MRPQESWGGNVSSEAIPWFYVNPGSSYTTKSIEIDTSRNLFIFATTQGNHGVGIFTPAQILASSQSSPLISLTNGNQTIQIYYDSSTGNMNFYGRNWFRCVVVYADEYIDLNA